MRESPQALNCFVLYRDMGPQRSLESLHQAYSDATPSVRQLKTWSAAHAWQERVRAHDQAIAAEAAERAKAERLAEMERLRRVRLGIASTEQAIALKWLQKVVQDDQRIAGLKAAEIVALARGAQDTQRLEYGEATDRTALDLEHMSDADLLARGRALGLDSADTPG